MSGDVVDDAMAAMDPDVPSITAAKVRAALPESGDVTLRINSGGGVATEGAAVHAVLADYPGKKTMIIEGVAASAASLIAMAGDEIVMAPGALLMIHDPSMITLGTEEEHRQSADALSAMSETYANVYAARSGLSSEEVREMMRAETWMGPEEAVAKGFADRVQETRRSAAAASFNYQIYANAPKALMGSAAGEQDEAASGNAGTSGRPEDVNTQAAATAVEQKEATMADEMTEPVAAPKAAAEEKPVMAADPKVIEAAVAAERKRVSEITAYAEKAKMPQMAAKLIEDGVPLPDAKDAILEAWAGEDSKATMRVCVTRDETQTKIEGIVLGMKATMFGGAVEGPGAEYRGMTPKKLAMMISGDRGFSVSDMDRVRSGMKARGVVMAGGQHSTSDFTYITGDVMNRQLREAYGSRPGTWSRISRQRTANDFRTLYSVQAGVDTEMRKVLESGEYQATVLSDDGESYRVERYGRKVHLTFEAVVNDDLGAFTRLPQDFARGARNLESRIVWALINANGNLSDGTALFATGAARRNLASSGAAISAATVGAARKAMWEQRPLGAKATGDDFISATPDLLFVPPALEIDAMSFVADTVPESDANVNPFKSTLEPVVEPRLGAAVSGGSDTAWYLFDSSMPTIEHAYLDGYAAPSVQSYDEMDPEGVTMLARHIFGAAPVEFRGAYKNAGA
ncbi:MAG: head maturation protease, ClpP-related [Pseudomonadota bacterium]